MMRVLITGASGYFAWELVRQLKQSNEHIIVGSSSNPNKLINDPNYSGIKLIHNNEIDVELDSIELIIHTAFCRKSDGTDLIKSLCFSRDVFKKAAGKGISIINLSSQSVYGSVKEKLPKEDAICSPEYLYAFAKASSELLLDELAYGKSKYTNVRLASLMGPSRTVPVNVLYKFVANALKGIDIKIQGGKQNFSFIDVRDAVEATIRLIKVEKWDSIYNLGPKAQTNIVELASIANNCALELVQKKVNVIINDTDESVNTGMNSDRIYKAINWEPSHKIEDIVKDTANYIYEILNQT